MQNPSPTQNKSGILKLIRNHLLPGGPACLLALFCAALTTLVLWVNVHVLGHSLGGAPEAVTIFTLANAALAAALSWQILLGNHAITWPRLIATALLFQILNALFGIAALYLYTMIINGPIGFDTLFSFWHWVGAATLLVSTTLFYGVFALPTLQPLHALASMALIILYGRFFMSSTHG